MKYGFCYRTISHASLFINLYIGYVEGCTNTNCCSARIKTAAPLSFAAEKAHFYDLPAVSSVLVIQGCIIPTSTMVILALMGARNSSTSSIQLQSVILPECPGLEPMQLTSSIVLSADSLPTTCVYKANFLFNNKFRQNMVC